MSRGLGFAILFVSLSSARLATAYDAYNNFGPGDTYDPTTGWSVTGGDYAPFIPHIQGSRFTSAATGILAVIRISLHNSFHDPPGFNQVDVRLYEADLAGNIGPIMAAFTRGGLPPFGGSEAPETISSFDPDVVLTTGKRYWITVAPGDHSTDAVWNWNSLGMGDRHANSSDFGATYSYTDARVGAMRIELISIPEPATLSVLFLGIAVMACRNRRKR
jgi:hypothetical protein